MNVPSDSFLIFLKPFRDFVSHCRKKHGFNEISIDITKPVLLNLEACYTCLFYYCLYLQHSRSVQSDVLFIHFEIGKAISNKEKIPKDEKAKKKSESLFNVDSVYSIDF